MNGIDKKIRRIEKTPGVFNWARLNSERKDETVDRIVRLADSSHMQSLRPIYGLCTSVANRSKSFDDCMAKISAYRGYHRDAAEGILPVFQNWVEISQVETVDAFSEENYLFPFARNDKGKVSSIPLKPHFVVIRGEQLRPTYLLGWAHIPLSLFQIRLACSVIRHAVLTRLDFIGADASVLTFQQDKWTKNRLQGEWSVNTFGNMPLDEVAVHTNRYSEALQEAIAIISSRDS